MKVSQRAGKRGRGAGRSRRVSTAEAAEPLAATLTVNTESSIRGVHCATALARLGPYSTGNYEVFVMGTVGER